MKTAIEITAAPIGTPKLTAAFTDGAGAIVEFSGKVRDLEDGKKISALEYEAYLPMAQQEIHRIFDSLAEQFPCLAVKVIHRFGVIPVGETAIYLAVAARHRGEALALAAEFMNRLKQDVPIWKRGAVAEITRDRATAPPGGARNAARPAMHSLDEACAKISHLCQPLPAVEVALADAFGRVLRQTIFALEDLPPFDCATRDGFAVLADDASPVFRVVDTIHAAGWQPRRLKAGEAVRVATGAPLPCDGLRVVMQEDVQCRGDRMEIVKPESAANLRRRGEELKAGQPLVPAGVRVDAGKLALLATAGCVQPRMSPRLRVAHFTTGDEIISPDQTPKPGQIRDSNSSLIHGLLQQFCCDLEQQHLSENFEAAWAQLDLNRIARADMVLISGGASVGEKDFTGPLLERLGFNIHFEQVNIRPGKPLIFATSGPRVAFGLPGNPLSHFVCFHVAVAAALAGLAGEPAPKFLRAKLAATLAAPPHPRETLWPAKLEYSEGEMKLYPLPWASSGDVTCFATANALLRVPVNRASLPAGGMVDFLPTNAMIGA